MKKLLLFTTLFLAFACSKDDVTDPLTDPLIGSWSGSFSETDEEDGESITINVEITLTINADGSGTQVYSYTFDGQTQTETEPSTWSNLSSNPDFSSTNQSYNLDGDPATVVFSSNFKTATITFSGEDYEGEEEESILLTKK